MEDIIIYTTIKAASDDPNAVDLRKTVRRFNL